MRQRLWFIGVSLLVVGITAVPYLLGYLFTPADKIYTGLIMNPEDAQSYFAKMQQGYAGHWQYTILFTPEPHDAAFVGGFYLFLGHVARWLGLSLTAVWHLSRTVFACILLLSLQPFMALFLPARSAQKIAFLLAIFGSGLGWLLFLLGQPYWLDAFPIDFKQPEARLFFTAMTFPHMAWATTLLLGYVGCLVRLVEERERVIGYWLVSGSLAILLGITAPFLVYVLIGLTFFLGLWLLVGQKRPFFPTLFRLALPLACAAPLFGYYAYILQTNGAFRIWDKQALTPAAPWPHYLLAYGLLLLLAGLSMLVGFLSGLSHGEKTPVPPPKGEAGWGSHPPKPQTAQNPANRKNSQPITILWLWVATVAALLFLPVNQPRRFVQGVDVPLAILATIALATMIWPRLTQAAWFQRLIQHPRYSVKGLSRLLGLFFLGFMGLSTLYLWASVGITAVFQQPDPLFRPRDEETAVRWLRENTNADAIVLGAYQTGSFVAGQAGRRVVIGHWAETGDFAEKETAVARFFQVNTDDAWRKIFLEQFNIAYIWHGPREQALGTFAPDQVDFLYPVFDNESITIYSVERLGD